LITHFFIDFDGVLTDNGVYVNSNGEEMVRCYRGDGIGLEKLKEAGIKPVIISTEKDSVVSKRAAKLDVSYVKGVKDKMLELVNWCEDLTKAAFIGNDLNDYEAMQIVGFPIAVADARPEIKEIAMYTTRARGGYGAVREACGWILKKSQS